MVVKVEVEMLDGMAVSEEGEGKKREEGGRIKRKGEEEDR